MCKTRNISVFKHGIFKNKILNIGVIIEVSFMLGFIYITWFQPFFHSAELGCIITNILLILKKLNYN